MIRLNFTLVFVAVAFLSLLVCNERTCYEQKIEAARFEWKNSCTGDKFLRVYKPDGTIVDLSGKNLKIESLKKPKEIKKKSRR